MAYKLVKSLSSHCCAVAFRSLLVE